MLPEGYRLKQGSSKDTALLVKFMNETYQELFPKQENFSHLAETVRKYFSSQTPLWLVELSSETEKLSTSIACLWMGTGVDQVTGERYAHIFLVYVAPQHRYQGIATALFNQAQNWAKSRGDRQMGLQVFLNNQSALNLYDRLGFKPQSLTMIKPLNNSFD
ncbi:GNAT family N-acetyltransferase [Gloeothece verrucosa]|uniref:GCN5-related N-acetyltransferase n=1 Tax=Gloeothece verrucosa (strain PCC 7822) TaxID=497965 RepID=E0U964_GLOV7|nr:GCN5-related N-acetyltransferase [Gloeothece verrucosa PCC 7822]